MQMIKDRWRLIQCRLFGCQFRISWLILGIHLGWINDMVMILLSLSRSMVVVTAWCYNIWACLFLCRTTHFCLIITNTFTCFYIFDFGIRATPCYVMDRKKFFVIGAAGFKLCLPWALLLRLVCFLFSALIGKLLNYARCNNLKPK